MNRNIVTNRVGSYINLLIYEDRIQNKKYGLDIITLNRALTCFNCLLHFTM